MSHSSDNRPVVIVEIKCFSPGSDFTQEVYTAFGQYLIYREALTARRITAPLYLVVPLTAYEAEFDAIILGTASRSGIRLVIVDIESEVIVQWIDHL